MRSQITKVDAAVARNGISQNKNIGCQATALNQIA
jgi:hypothetical protein